MTIQNPLILVSGHFSQLPVGDTVPGTDPIALASGNAALEVAQVALASGNAGLVVGASGVAIAEQAMPKAGGEFTGDVIFGTNTAIQIPVGTTAERPTASDGLIRFNSSINNYEGYNGTDWVPFYSYTINVKDFGAVGDGVTDDSAAINSALTYWAAASGRHLHFPEGTYIYGGSASIDLSLSFRRYNKITMDGAISPTSSASIQWKITEAEVLYLQLNIVEGGTLGDFTNSTSVGGTTFLQVHSIGWGRFDITSMDYVGRVLHTTAGGTDALTRCRMLDINLRTGSRLIRTGYAYCGQPIFADSASCTQTGAWGRITWRGEGHVYGPVFERLNDIEIVEFEAGKFTTAGTEFRGCVNVYANTIFLGELDAATTPLLSFKNNAGGRKCSGIALNKVSFIDSDLGLFCEDFDPASPGLVIDQFISSSCDVGFEINTMPYVSVNKLSGKNSVNLVKKSGTCGDIYIGVNSLGAVTGDGLYIEDAHDSFTIAGNLRGGASAYSLINYFGNSLLYLENLNMESSDCTQMLNINTTDQTNIRHIGGSVSGSSLVYTSGRRPELIRDVKGLQTHSLGSSVITSGTSSVLVNTGLDVNVQVANAIGVGSETAGIFAPTYSGAYVLFSVANPVTANRTIYWQADSTLIRGDVDA